MNPCWKLSLFQGARYVAIADFIYAILTAIFIVFELISTTRNGVAINNVNVPLSDTSLSQVLVTYLVLSIINMILAIVLYAGITTDNLQKCRSFVIVSTLSTAFGLGTLVYHGAHLNSLEISLLNSEFFIAIIYHVYKLYALLVIAAFVHELNKLLTSNSDESVLKRRRYQSLDSTNGDEGQGEAAKHVFFGIPFSDKHYVSEEKFKIDYDTCIEYEENTSTLKGVLQMSHDPSNKRDVAVKILKSSFRTEKHMIELIKEAKLLFYVGNHEHIIKLLAIHCETPPEDMSRKGNVMLFMEDYPARRLNDFLRKSFEHGLMNFQNLLTSETTRLNRRRKRLGTLHENFEIDYYRQLEPFTTIHMIQWAYQLSSALDYLHSRNIVFGNLQAKSIILEKMTKIKLSNFELASELHEDSNTVTSIYLPGKISWRWTALECLISTNQGLPTVFNEKTDVWSYASTLCEIFSIGHAPNVPSSLSEYIGTLEKGKRAEKPEFASEGIYNLMKTCWSENPSDRPSFNVISLFFRQLLSKSIYNDFG